MSSQYIASFLFDQLFFTAIDSMPFVINGSVCGRFSFQTEFHCFALLQNNISKNRLSSGDKRPDDGYGYTGLLISDLLKFVYANNADMIHNVRRQAGNEYESVHQKSPFQKYCVEYTTRKRHCQVLFSGPCFAVHKSPEARASSASMTRKPAFTAISAKTPFPRTSVPEKVPS